MPIRQADVDVVPWEEPTDAIRVVFDSWPLLSRADMTVEQAQEDRGSFHALLAEALGEEAAHDLRSPGPDVGPHAGDGFYTFIDVIVTAGGLASALEIATRVARKLRAFDPRAHVSDKAIEEWSRQQLRFHGHPEDSLLVAVNMIARPDTSGPVGMPPKLLGFASVFRLDDGRLVTMRWTLEGLLEDYSEGGSPTA